MHTTAFNPVKTLELGRYNGGWTKSVTGLDKSRANGYSIRGDFMRPNASDIYAIGGLYLDCNISGSRKNYHKTYRLFRVTGPDSAEVLVRDDSNSPDWAVNLWAAIEAALAPTEATPNPLAQYRTEELIAELKRREVAP
jgi:hypothetical protein